MAGTNRESPNAREREAIRALDIGMVREPGESMMQDAYQLIRELARKALLACEGNWHQAEALINRWLAEDPAQQQQLMQALLEFHLRHAITTEGRRQQQQAADLRREALMAQEQGQETTQTVEEFLRELQRPGGDEGEKR